MEAEDITKIVMNTTRMRIIQYLLLHDTGTTAQIGEALSDVPIASLYRHMKLLENAGLILVVQENKKRGTLEKVYQLEQENLVDSEEPDKEQIGKMIRGTLLSILAQFEQYLKRKDTDIKKDMMSVSSSTLLLTDEEYAAFLEEIGEVYNKVIHNKPDGKRRMRKITFISSPCEREE